MTNELPILDQIGWNRPPLDSSCLQLLAVVLTRVEMVALADQTWDKALCRETSRFAKLELRPYRWLLPARDLVVGEYEERNLENILGIFVLAPCCCIVEGECEGKIVNLR